MKENRNKVYTVQASVAEALARSDNAEWKAELYLCTVLKDPLSKRYTKLVKKIAKVAIIRAKHIKRQQKKPDAIDPKKLEKLESTLMSLLTEKKETVSRMTGANRDFSDAIAVAKGLVSRHHGGLMFKDAIDRLLTHSSAYGRFVRTVYRDLCPNPIWKKAFVVITRRETRKAPFERDRESHWNNKQISTREQAILAEQAFVLYLLTMALEDFSEEEIRRMLDEIAAEIQSLDETLSAQIREIRSTGNITGGAAKAIVQIVRLSVGKGVFMNASVKITNVVLRAAMQKGMTFSQNAALRKWLAGMLGKGRWNIAVTLAMFIPDIFALLHRRDRANVITAMLLLYQMRHFEAKSDEAN